MQITRDLGRCWIRGMSAGVVGAGGTHPKTKGPNSVRGTGFRLPGHDQIPHRGSGAVVPTVARAAPLKPSTMGLICVLRPTSTFRRSRSHLHVSDRTWRR